MQSSDGGSDFSLVGRQRTDEIGLVGSTPEAEFIRAADEGNRGSRPWMQEHALMLLKAADAADRIYGPSRRPPPRKYDGVEESRRAREGRPVKRCPACGMKELGEILPDCIETAYERYMGGGICLRCDIGDDQAGDYLWPDRQRSLRADLEAEAKEAAEAAEAKYEREAWSGYYAARREIDGDVDSDGESN